MRVSSVDGTARRSTSSARPDRQPDERRVDAEDVPDPTRRPASDGGPSATIRPASSTTTRGKKWAASARSWRTATIVVPSRRFSSTSSSMTSTWWRMSRWAVGSSRTRIGADCATATAMNTSCRSPIDSSRTSRWRRSPIPTRSIAPSTAVMSLAGARSAAARAASGRGRRPPRPASRTAARRAPARPRSSARRVRRWTRSIGSPTSSTEPDRGVEHAGQGPQQRRLAGAVRPDERHVVPRADDQVSGVDHGPVAVPDRRAASRR